MKKQEKSQTIIYKIDSAESTGSITEPTKLLIQNKIAKLMQKKEVQKKIKKQVKKEIEKAFNQEIQKQFNNQLESASEQLSDDIESTKFFDPTECDLIRQTSINMSPVKSNKAFKQNTEKQLLKNSKLLETHDRRFSIEVTKLDSEDSKQELNLIPTGGKEHALLPLRQIEENSNPDQEQTPAHSPEKYWENEEDLSPRKKAHIEELGFIKGFLLDLKEDNVKCNSKEKLLEILDNPNNPEYCLEDETITRIQALTPPRKALLVEKVSKIEHFEKHKSFLHGLGDAILGQTKSMLVRAAKGNLAPDMSEKVEHMVDDMFHKVHEHDHDQQHKEIIGATELQTIPSVVIHND
jgi:hypothetical protein